MDIQQFEKLNIIITPLEYEHLLNSDGIEGITIILIKLKEKGLKIEIHDF